MAGSFFPVYHGEAPVVPRGGGVVSVPGWGCLGGVQAEEAGRRFLPLYDRRPELWRPTEPALLPLLPPNDDGGLSPAEESQLVYKKRSQRQDTDPHRAGVTLHFSRQIGQLCRDQGDIAFHCMGQLLEPHYHLSTGRLYRKPVDQCVLRIPPLLKLRKLQSPECPYPYNGYRVRALSHLTGDWLQDLPPAMLGQLVHEGLADDWRQLQLRESGTGGALCWAAGCLIYPRGAAMNQLHFQKVCTHWSGVRLQGAPAVFELQHPILQISTGDSDSVYVGVRSTYNVAAWSFSAEDPPKPLGVLRTKSPCTCVAVSPHLPGQLCVCTEGGHVYLWSLERGLQSVRQEQESLFFRDDRLWRWSDFSSHPRVLLYADRTGVQAADTRVPGAAGSDLFRVGQESSCERGERLILARCLRETNPAHYLVTTQFSVYVMDERFPLVPLVSWPHMLDRPPTFACALPGRTNKLLLAAQHSQETLLLQYSGGSSDPCQLHLPALRLPRAKESLHHLDPMLPHQHAAVARRLAAPTAGLAAAHVEEAPESLIVFQLTEAGDVFRQRLVYTAAGSTHEDSSSTLKPNPTVEGSDRTSRGPSPASGNISGPSTEDCGSGGTAPQPIPADPADGSALPPRKDATSETSPGDVQGSPENESVSANQRGSISPTHEGIDKDSSGWSPTLTAGSKHRFRSWIRALLKNCKRTQKVPERPGCAVTRLFIGAELRNAASEGPGLRERLWRSMKNGTLVKLEPLPVPETTGLMPTEGGKDVVSQRLSAAWENRLASWWDDYLGLNKASKIQALRDKRAKLKRTRSHSSLSGSFSSFSDYSNFFETEATPSWLSDTDTNVLSTSAVIETQRSESPAAQGSVWSFQSGPSVRPNLPHPCLQAGSESTDLNCPSIVSSRSLRSKGIPRERRKTLQDFVTSFGEQLDSPAQPTSTSPVTEHKLPAPSQSSSPLSLLSHRRRMLYSHSVQRHSQSELTSPQTSSQNIELQTSSQTVHPQSPSQRVRPQTSQVVQPQTRSQTIRPQTSSQNIELQTSSHIVHPHTRSQKVRPQTSSQNIELQTSQTVHPQTRSQTIRPQTSQVVHPQTRSQTSSQIVHPQTRSQKVRPQASSQNIELQTSSQIVRPQTRSQKVRRQVSQVVQPQTSQTIRPQASSQNIELQTSSKIVHPQSRSQKVRRQASYQNTQLHTSSQVVQPQTSSQTIRPQTSQTVHPQTSQKVQPNHLSKSFHPQSGPRDVALLTPSQRSKELSLSQSAVKRPRMGF